MKLIIKFAILMVLLFSSAIAAQGRYDQALLLTDIAKKQLMGFSANKVVYELQNNDSLDQSADKYFDIAMGGNIVRIGYLGIEAEGRTSDFEYGTANGIGDIYRTSASELFADILLDLDHGANFNFLRIWGNDTNLALDMRYFLLENCLPFDSAGNITTTLLGTIDSGTNSGLFSVLIDITASAVIVDNLRCTYSLRTRFNTTDNTLVLFKVRAQTYVL